jgi:hypothetical protein
VVRVDVEHRRLRKPVVRLLPGSRPAKGLPIPGPMLADVLLPHVPGHGDEAAVVVRKAVKAWPNLFELLRGECREVLAARACSSRSTAGCSVCCRGPGGCALLPGTRGRRCRRGWRATPRPR